MQKRTERRARDEALGLETGNEAALGEDHV